MGQVDRGIGILCVEDNTEVAQTLRMKFDAIEGFDWRGWLPNADELISTAKRLSPRVVVLDLDMPGKNPLEALAELRTACPDTRVVVFTGHVGRDLVDRALDAGAWGYVSKNDGEDALVHAVRQVHSGELGLSPEVQSLCNWS